MSRFLCQQILSCDGVSKPGEVRFANAERPEPNAKFGSGSGNRPNRLPGSVRSSEDPQNFPNRFEPVRTGPNPNRFRPTPRPWLGVHPPSGHCIHRPRPRSIVGGDVVSSLSTLTSIICVKTYLFV